MAPFGPVVLWLVFFAGVLQAKTYSDSELRRLTAGDGTVAPSSGRVSPHAHAGLKVILENGFEYRPWLFEQTSKIRNGYGLEAITALVRKYDEIEDGVFEYCALIDTPQGLAAFKELIKNNRTIYVWQTRWTVEVHTWREYEAYVRTISRRHTEAELARASMLDGPKNGGASGWEARQARERAEHFEPILQEAVDGLPPSCRARLDGARVLAQEWQEPGVPEETVVRWTPSARTKPKDGVCAERSPGKMVVYFGAFQDLYPEGGAEELGALMVERMGCRAKPRPVILAKAEDLRDALAPVKRKPKKRLFCPVRRYEAPRLSVYKPAVTKRRALVVTAEMEQNAADPNLPPMPSKPAPGAPPVQAKGAVSPAESAD